MWKPEHRAAADRRGLRYESDLTDAEWALVAPLIRPAKRGGRPRTVNVREVLNAIFYVLWTGCQWKALPKDLPPRSTVWEYLDLWDWDGTLGRIHHALYVAVRERRAAKRARQRRSLTVRPRRGPSKGGFARPVRVRCRQEGRWPQAPYPDRYARPATGDQRPSRQRAGSRRRKGAAPGGATELSVHRAHHRRRRLPGTKDASRRRPHRHVGTADRSALRPSPLRRAPKTLDRGAHAGMDQPLPSARARLRATRPKSRGLRPPRHDPPHAAAPRPKPLIRNSNFPEGL
jgi:transposase